MKDSGQIGRKKEKDSMEMEQVYRRSRVEKRLLFFHYSLISPVLPYVSVAKSNKFETICDIGGNSTAWTTRASRCLIGFMVYRPTKLSMGVNWLKFIRRKKVVDSGVTEAAGRIRANCPIIVDSSFLSFPLYFAFFLLLFFFLLFLFLLLYPSFFARSSSAKALEKGQFHCSGLFPEPIELAGRERLFYFIFTPAGVDTPRRKRKNEETKRRVNSGCFSLQNSTSKRPVDQAD